MTEDMILAKKIADLGSQLKVENNDESIYPLNGRKRLLPIIKESPDGITQNELARKAHISLSTCSEHTARLINDGYITRHSSSHDRRKKVLSLTMEGEKACNELSHQSPHFIEDVFSVLESEEKVRLSEMLDRLMDKKKQLEHAAVNDTPIPAEESQLRRMIHEIMKIAEKECIPFFVIYYSFNKNLYCYYTIPRKYSNIKERYNDPKFKIEEFIQKSPGIIPIETSLIDWKPAKKASHERTIAEKQLLKEMDNLKDYSGKWLIPILSGCYISSEKHMAYQGFIHILSWLLYDLDEITPPHNKLDYLQHHSYDEFSKRLGECLTLYNIGIFHKYIQICMNYDREEFLNSPCHKSR